MLTAAVLITAPAAAVLTREEVKRHLRVDHDDDNTTIDEIIAAAVGTIDPAAGGWLGRALRPQTWELRLSELPACGIPLPYPPLLQVDSFKYFGTSGVDQVLAAETGYRTVIGRLGRVTLLPPFAGHWPSARCDVDSIRIRFTAGYLPADTQADPPVVDQLPAPIKAWLKLVIGSFYENRESFTKDAAIELPPHVLSMIETYRIYS